MGEREHVGGKSQPTLSTVLSAVKEENRCKGKRKKAANINVMEYCYIKTDCLFSAHKAVFFLSPTAYAAIRETGVSKYQ